MSAIRERLNVILTTINKPVTAEEIKEKADVRWGVDNIRMALKAMARDGQCLQIQPGFFAHKGYKQERPKKRDISKPEKLPRETAKSEVKSVDKKSEKAESPLPKEVDEALTTMEFKVRGKSVDDLELKVAVLDRLADITEPSIARVLHSVRDDVKTLAAV